VALRGDGDDSDKAQYQYNQGNRLRRNVDMFCARRNALGNVTDLRCGNRSGRLLLRMIPSQFRPNREKQQESTDGHPDCVTHTLAADQMNQRSHVF
jgi:hypothetical protein